MNKAIFEYQDAAGQIRYGDPWAIDHRLRRLLGGKDPWSEVAKIDSDNPVEALQAEKKVALAACLAFELGKPFDPLTGQGVTITTWKNAIDSWLEWMEKNAQAASSYLTCSEPDSALPTPAQS